MKNLLKELLERCINELKKLRRYKELIEKCSKEFKKLQKYLTQKPLLEHLKDIPLNLHTALIGFSILGILGLFRLVILTSQNPPINLPVSKPSSPIYKDFIAASGIIESSSNNILLSPIVGGVVAKIYVNVGDKVKKGDPLFCVDTRQAESDWELKKTQLDQAKAALKQAEIQMKNTQKKFELAKAVKDKRAISQDDYLTRENAATIDKAAYEVAAENLKIAQAQEKVSKTNLDILTTCAPDDCQILQINISPGEYAPIASGNNTNSNQAMILGKVDCLQIRIDIDETEAWRFKKGSHAIAYIRGNGQIKMDLKFDHVEPFVLPKTSLTGNSTERVDTRVLQVIYQFTPGELNVYVGQQVDVYIEDAKETAQKAQL